MNVYMCVYMNIYKFVLLFSRSLSLSLSLSVYFYFLSTPHSNVSCLTYFITYTCIWISICMRMSDCVHACTYLCALVYGKVYEIRQNFFLLLSFLFSFLYCAWFSNNILIQWIVGTKGACMYACTGIYVCVCLLLWTQSV